MAQRLLQTATTTIMQRTLHRRHNYPLLCHRLIRKAFSSTAKSTTTAPVGVDGLPLVNPTTFSRPVRPFFPWRHEPVGIELPRLTPGTPEYRNSIRFTETGRRFTAYWFLGGSIFERFLNFGNYQQKLADNAAYAFSQAVSGIIRDIYRLPNKLQYTETGDVYIQVAANNVPVVSNKSAMASKRQQQKPQNKLQKVQRVKQTQNKLRIVRRKQLDGLLKLRSRQQAKSSAMQRLQRKRKSRTRRLLNFQSSRRQRVRRQQSQLNLPTAEMPADNVSTASSEDWTSRDDMLLSDLKNLYESAHRSGRDQLLIRLECEPLHAHLYDLIAIPYVTREEAVIDPSKLVKMRDVRKYPPHESLHTIMDVVEADMEEKSKLETTVELQVYIVCKERFQVVDRLTGRVLQGTENFEPQLVGHLVRLECTSTLRTNDRVHGTSNWQIADIDDLANPVPWYGSYSSE